VRGVGTPGGKRTTTALSGMPEHVLTAVPAPTVSHGTFRDPRRRAAFPPALRETAEPVSQALRGEGPGRGAEKAVPGQPAQVLNGRWHVRERPTAAQHGRQRIG